MWSARGLSTLLHPAGREDPHAALRDAGVLAPDLLGDGLEVARSPIFGPPLRGCGLAVRCRLLGSRTAELQPRVLAELQPSRLGAGFGRLALERGDAETE